ncbi:RidA family protein [uncultured Flavobacterium sp.]|uniref:RidA family protein n=1 Tax=uncultured Flavobacterium sp. TaxID=165435 RepID=UPI0025FF12DC|nr:RidA family protein [uncultured Flavobacterium sp.]
MAVQFLNPDTLMKSPAFSQVAITSGSGRTIYIGGQNAVNEKGEVVGKGNIAAQTEQVMFNIEAALEAAGAGIKDIIKMNIYITQGQDIRKGFEASQRFFKDNANQPVITSLFVAGMGNPNYLLEIDAVAFVEG